MADYIIDEIKSRMSDQLISVIYKDKIRTLRTRRIELNAPATKTSIEVMHTLLGVELKVGRKRITCPDLSTARYLTVFARLGVTDVAIPYDITQIARLADDLESSWHRMLMLAEHLAEETGLRSSSSIQQSLIKDQRNEVLAIGSGPAIPQFNQNTRQRRTK